MLGSNPGDRPRREATTKPFQPTFELVATPCDPVGGVPDHPPKVESAYASPVSFGRLDRCWRHHSLAGARDFEHVGQNRLRSLRGDLLGVYGYAQPSHAHSPSGELT